MPPAEHATCARDASSQPRASPPPMEERMERTFYAFRYHVDIGKISDWLFEKFLSRTCELYGVDRVAVRFEPK